MRDVEKQKKEKYGNLTKRARSSWKTEMIFSAKDLNLFKLNTIKSA